MDNICIIPARAESKRLVGKNRLLVNGQLNIGRIAEIAKKSMLFKNIILYTDDGWLLRKEPERAEWYIRMARKKSDDNETLAELIKTFLESKIKAKNIMIFYPTALFVTKNDIIAGYKKLIAHDCVFPIVQTHALSHNLYIENDIVKPCCDHGKDKNTHMIKTYKHAGQWWWLNVEKFKNNETLFPINAGYVQIPMAIDIDTKEDLEIARLLKPDWQIEI